MQKSRHDSAVKEGDRVFELCNRGDYLIQQWGGSVDSNRADEQWKEYREIIIKKIHENIPNAKQIMDRAENIAIGKFIPIPKHLTKDDLALNVFDDSFAKRSHSLYDIGVFSSWLYGQCKIHTTIHSPYKWKQYIAPRITK